MPSGIDVMIWDDYENKEIVAVPVSVSGRKFLRGLTGDPEAEQVVMRSGIDEFTSHISPGMKIFFNREDGSLVQLGIKNCLQ